MRFDLPVEIRNEITRLDIAGERSAGAVQLIDSRWARRTVGVVSGATSDTAQPLLSPTYYLGRALEPFADIRTVEGASPSDAILRFIESRVPMIVLTDVGTVTPTARQALNRFLDGGGILLLCRNAPCRRAGRRPVPVRLRRGGRQLGGALSWETPQALAPFGRESPFADIQVPADVRVRRQVLAEPDGLLADKTWAQLADGTPLVTARSVPGLLVLFPSSPRHRLVRPAAVRRLRRHAEADRRAVRRRQAGTDGAPAAPGQARAAERVAPTRVLDGYGAFIAPPATAKPIPSDWRTLPPSTPRRASMARRGHARVNVLTPRRRAAEAPGCRPPLRHDRTLSSGRTG